MLNVCFTLFATSLMYFGSCVSGKMSGDVLMNFRFHVFVAKVTNEGPAMPVALYERWPRKTRLKSQGVEPRYRRIKPKYRSVVEIHFFVKYIFFIFSEPKKYSFVIRKCFELFLNTFQLKIEIKQAQRRAAAGRSRHKRPGVIQY